MATISISLPTALRDWVDDQARNGTFADASEYVRDLVYRERDRAASVAEVQAKLDEGFASGVSDRTMDEILEIARSRSDKASVD